MEVEPISVKNKFLIVNTLIRLKTNEFYLPLCNANEGVTLLYFKDNVILAFCNVIITKNGSEVYNVYALDSELFDQMMTTVLTLTNKPVWIGLGLHNRCIDLYIKAGFSFDIITRTTPYTVSKLPEYKVGLTSKFYKQQMPPKKEIALCSNLEYFNVKIEPKIVDKIVPYLDRDRETAGILKAKTYKNNVLLYRSINETQAEDDNKFHIKTCTSGCEFVYHTHPKICYDTLNLHLAWPSVGDLVNRIWEKLNDAEPLMHFIFSVEGVYSIQVNPVFLPFLNEIKDTPLNTELINSLSDALHVIQEERKDTKTASVDNFISTVNRLTLKKIALNVPLKLLNLYSNIAMFDVSFCKYTSSIDFILVSKLRN
jgi:hypothetical protein